MTRTLRLTALVALASLALGSSAVAAPRHLRSGVPASACIGPAATPTPPPSDPFYAAPTPLPPGHPGTIIRSRPVCLNGLGADLPLRAWQVMYLSTGVEDTADKPSDLHAAPTVDVATIIAPLTSGATPPGLVSFQEPEDADSELAAPSYGMRNSLGDYNDLQWLPLLSEGNDVIVPDFEGLRSEFWAAPQAAHAILDGVRAAEHFAPAGLSGRSTPVALWGYSGGGQATVWASELAPRYAPDLHLVGVAEGGVTKDLPAVIDNLDGGPLAYLMFEGFIGLGFAYDNLFYDEQPNPGNGERGGAGVTGLDTVLNPAGQALVAAYKQDVNNAPAFADLTNFTWCGCNPVDRPAEFPGIAKLMALDEMGQTGHVPSAPVYIYEAYADEIVPFAGAQQLVDKYCSEGVDLDFRVDYTSEHISAEVTGLPSALAYLSAALAGTTPPTTCGLPAHAGPPLNPPVNPGSLLKNPPQPAG